MTDLRNPIFSNEDKARAHFEAIRWPDGPYCPHCGNSDQDLIHKIGGTKHRPGLHQCYECREHFTVTVGSVMERSKVPLTKWALAFHLMNSSKKGMSAHQLHRMLAVTYKTAWFMAHRIREAMADNGKAGRPGQPGDGRRRLGTPRNLLCESPNRRRVPALAGARCRALA